MRLSTSAVARSESWMLQRNKDVLLAQGREAAERMIEREFERIDATVRRDLAEYPALHRQLRIARTITVSLVNWLGFFEHAQDFGGTAALVPPLYD
jgi:hypothetical protein